MINEGYHIKDLDGVVMMRPTFSPTIFTQQLGRALTVGGDKKPVVLDLVNNFDSCKIIEDFAERMRQYKRRDGSGRIEETKRSRISIFDKTKEFKLCYVPSEYKKNLQDCVTEFRKNGISCGIDAAAKYPWILPVILLLLSFAFVFYAKNKILYIICAIFPNLFLFCNPFYSCAVSSCILLLCLFFVTNLWQRKGFLDRILHSYKVLILLVLSIVSSFSASILSGIFCLLTLMSVCGVCILYDFVNSKISSRYSFMPIYILPAKSVSIYAGKFKMIMPIILSASFLIILSFMFSSNGKSISSASEIVLPGNSSAKSDDLPSLQDFYVWNWDVLTYPVKNLNINSNSSDKVIFPRFVQEENKLKQINKDTVGWLKVNGTDIEYAIVKTNDNSYYLEHNFEKEYNKAGWIFADYKNKLDGTDKNIVIYGHNRRDGSMFSSLKNILKEEWYSNEENFVIDFITEQEQAKYQVFSVYKTHQSNFNNDTNFENDQIFEDYLNLSKNNSIYNFNVNITPYDKILTIYTCANNNQYRIIVHAKQLEN